MDPYTRLSVAQREYDQAVKDEGDSRRRREEALLKVAEAGQLVKQAEQREWEKFAETFEP